MKVQIIRAPRGSTRTCKGWIQEAAYRMLCNNLDPEVAEKPDELIVYGGTGKAARNWEAFHQIVKALHQLENDETLLIQSGKPVGILKTHPWAPRILIANSNLVPKWATWEVFRDLERKGLIMYGQMTAGSWIYIGSQGIIQGTYETFGAVANKHFNGSLEGKLCVTAGLGGMGGAQPLAITMNGGVCLAAEVDPERVERRLQTGYLDEVAHSIDEAIDRALKYAENKEARSVAVVANAVDLLQRLKERNITPDVLTDQTSAHDLLNGYVPAGLPFEEAIRLRHQKPDEYLKRSKETVARHVELMLHFHRLGTVTFDYGNNIRAQAFENGVKDAFEFPGFVQAYIRPLFCEGKGPFRWVALSGDPKDIYTTDRMILELFPDNQHLKRWITQAQKKIKFQGLPARICWLGIGERDRAGLAFNHLVRTGKVSAPIVIGRDHLDTGSVASPYRETEGMKDGSDPIADWPILNALLNTASGAGWVAFHHGGGVGIGYSLHAGMVVVCDGTEDADKRIERVLFNDPALGIIRHADAGYETAIQKAKETGIYMPDRLSEVTKEE